MKPVLWILAGALIAMCVVRSCGISDRTSALQRRYDSVATVGVILSSRAKVLEGRLAMERNFSRSIQQAAKKESDSLIAVADWWRNHPRVKTIRETIHEVDTAFVIDSMLIRWQKEKILEIIAQDSSYKATDSLYHLTQDSVIENLRYGIHALQKVQKQNTRLMQFGFAGGPGFVVSPDGRVYGGMAVSGGIVIRIRKRSR